MKQQSKQNGFAVVFMVMIVSAVSLSVSLLLAERSLFLNTSAKLSASQQTALYAAEACAERALLEVRDDNNFEGTLNYTVDETDCSAIVTNEGDEERRLEVSSTNKSETANLEVKTIELMPQLTTTWIDAKSF